VGLDIHFLERWGKMVQTHRARQTDLREFAVIPVHSFGGLSFGLLGQQRGQAGTVLWRERQQCGCERGYGVRLLVFRFDGASGLRVRSFS
jgi:hypothetical protein